ncbi:MAG: cation transporter [Verrucomicrobia bacterium]|nr:cation transporter [Verrucomicrobiota bacterium]
MSKFPKPLPLHRSVTKTRLARRKKLLLSARRGVILRGVIIFAEFFGFAFFGSSTLLLDALSNSVDAIASIALIWSIHKADQPPDEKHPLGHGRFEPIAGLLIGFLLVFLGVVSTMEQVKAVFTGELTREIPTIAMVIPLIAVILLEICHQILKKAAKQKQSPALLADAAHYRIDALTSFFALIVLCLVALFPAHAHIFDHLGAITIALFMIVVGVIAARKNINQLIDRAPPAEMYEQVRAAALKVPGILATEKLRLQVYGPDAFVAIDVEVEPDLTVEESHKITQKVRRAIQTAWPSVRDVIVHVEPYYPGDHDS